MTVKPAARTLAEFAVELRYEDIPSEIVERAKACIIDTIAATIFCATLPWSKIVIAHVQKNGALGKAIVWGTALRLQAPGAAFANGALAHAFELDCTYHPSVGEHSGAALTSPGLAVAQSCGKSGRDLITAFVAASEVMYRIGHAGNKSIEKLGFHAPGLLGVFGGAIAAGRLWGLDVEQMTNALGIGGSLCSGVLEFSKSGGGHVKHLHIGRAAESGVMAAELAHGGFTGPHTVFEGEFGFLNIYCRDAISDRLTADLGKVWRTQTILHKRYACHTLAHVPVEAVMRLKTNHGISSDDVASISIASSAKMVSHHNIREPQDMAMAQYSTPFCIALALCRDLRDPTVFCIESLNDPMIRSLCRKVKLEVFEGHHAYNQQPTRVKVILKDGRELVQNMVDFPGMPNRPLRGGALREKFDILTKSLPQATADRIFIQFDALETINNTAHLEMS